MHRMHRTRSALVLMGALSLSLASAVNAQTPASPTPGVAPAATPNVIDSRPTAALARPALPGGAAGSASPTGTAPASTNVPAGSMIPEVGTLPGAAGARLGNLPAGSDPALRQAPGAGVDGSVLPGEPVEPDAGAPGSEEAGTGAFEPGTGTTPLLVHTLDPEPAQPLTPVPVVPLSLLYSVILLLAGGYLWYTARLAASDSNSVRG